MLDRPGIAVRAGHVDGERTRWFQRHPRLALLAVNGALAALFIALAEIGLRFWVPFDPGYYVLFPEEQGTYRYPYGLLKRNSRGFPDEEFDLSSSKPRVGYFGDSVTWGLGAGSGYRITDLLETLKPEVEHWTFGVASDGIDDETRDRIVALADEYQLAEVVYLFNLNDMLPISHGAQGERSLLASLRQHLTGIDGLRGRSYLYSALRFRFAEFMEARGYGYHGWKAAELFPTENADVVRETAQRIHGLAAALRAQGRRFTVILLPYEMQISEEAARVYSELGIRWEDGFLSDSTQLALRRALGDDVNIIDTYRAFVDPADERRSRLENGVGEYFVYNRGDKLDWDHPNRAGHAKIAEYLARLGEPQPLR